MAAAATRSDCDGAEGFGDGDDGFDDGDDCFGDGSWCGHMWLGGCRIDSEHCCMPLDFVGMNEICECVPL
jgi:hypothetical protein